MLQDMCVNLGIDVAFCGHCNDSRTQTIQSCDRLRSYQLFVAGVTLSVKTVICTVIATLISINLRDCQTA